MRETKQHVIDGFAYDITQLGSKQGRLVLARIMRSVAGAAGPAADSEGVAAVLKGIAALVEKISDADVEYLCDTFAATTMVGPASADARVPLKDKFDDHFAGKYGSMLKWLWAGLETNFSSFLTDLGLDLGALVTEAKQAMAAAKSAPSTSPPGSSSPPASGG